MKEVNRDELNFRDFSNGKYVKEEKLWKTIYNIVKLAGIIGLFAAVAYFGIAVTTAVIASLIGVAIGGVKLLKVIPTRKALGEENKRKVGFMVELAEKGVTVDSNDFELTKVTRHDARKDAHVEIGDEVKRPEVFGKTGTIHTYYQFKDNKNIAHFLVSDQEFYLNSSLLEKGDGFISKIASKMSYGLLEEEDIELLPDKVYDSLCENSNIKIRSRKK